MAVLSIQNHSLDDIRCVLPSDHVILDEADSSKCNVNPILENHQSLRLVVSLLLFQCQTTKTTCVAYAKTVPMYVLQKLLNRQKKHLTVVLVEAVLLNTFVCKPNPTDTVKEYKL